MQVPAETVTVEGKSYPLTVTAVVPLGRVTEDDQVDLPDPPVGWRWQPGFSFAPSDEPREPLVSGPEYDRWNVDLPDRGGVDPALRMQPGNLYVTYRLERG